MYISVIVYIDVYVYIVYIDDRCVYIYVCVCVMYIVSIHLYEDYIYIYVCVMNCHSCFSIRLSEMPYEFRCFFGELPARLVADCPGST